MACAAYDQPAPLPVQPSPTPALDPRASIRIGVLHGTTGGYAPLGIAANEGVLLALGVEQPTEVAGRRIIPVFEDTEGKPNVALARVRKLVEQDKVALLVGPTSNSELAAIRDYVVAQGVPLLVTFADPVRGNDQGSRLFWLNGASQSHVVAGWYAVKQAGYRRAGIVASDYRAGTGASEAFLKAFEQAGGVIEGQVLVPLGAPDTAPYASQVRRLGIAAGFVAVPRLVGAVAAELVTGLGATPTMVSAASNVPSAAPPAAPVAEGTLNYGEWRSELDTPANRTFTAGIRQAFKKEPTLHHMYGYLAGKLAIQALTATKGTADDLSALIKALEGLDLAAPGGRFRFDRRHFPVVAVHIWQGQRAGSETVTTIEDVSNEWRIPN